MKTGRQLFARFSQIPMYLLLMFSAFSMQAQEVYCARVDFTAVEKEGGIVEFTGTSDKPVAEWYWYFGDQNTSREVSPSNTYLYAGDYEVCVKVLVSNTCTGAVCKRIRVERGALGGACDLKSDFKYEVTGNKLVAKGWSNANANTTRYFWKFGDNNGGEGTEVRHEYSQKGEFTVCLTVVQASTTATGLTCTETVCKTIRIGEVNNPCDIEADFKFEIREGVFYAIARSNAGNNARYFWKISDGTTADGVEIKHQFKERGDYEVCLVVSKPATSANQHCTATVCKKVSIKANVDAACPLKADFFFLSTTAGVGLQARSNDPNAVYNWTIEGLNATYSGKNVRVPLTRPGVYKICLTVYSREFECRVQVCKRVVIGRSSGLVYPNPTTDNVRLYAEETITSYQLLDRMNNQVLGGLLSSNDTTLDLMHLPAGMYYLLLTYEDGSTSVEKILKH